MSLRPCIPTVRRALRAFSTTSVRPQTAPSPSSTSTPGPSSSSSSSGGGGGFSALRDLFSTLDTKPEPINPTLSSSVPSIPYIPTVSVTSHGSHAPSRGYSPMALPPPADPVLAMLTNLLMRQGKKTMAEGYVKRILQILQETSNQPPIPLLRRAIRLVSPSVGIVRTRKGIKNIDVPKGLHERQRIRQAISWILKAAESTYRSTSHREERIAREIFRVLEGESQVFTWLEERHRTAAHARANISR